MSLGTRIAELRKGRGMSQADLAQKLNIGVSTLGMWETDKRKPNPEALSEIAIFFGVTSDYLLNINSTPKWATQQDSLDLRAYLNDPAAQNSFNFGGVKLTKEQEEKMQVAITQIFWEQLKNKKNSL